MECTDISAETREEDERLWLIDGTCIEDLKNEPFDAAESEETAQPQYTPKMTLNEFYDEGRAYTKKALEELKQTPDYKRWNERCTSCHACWHDGEFGTNCAECGANHMQRLCPICDGKCGRVWQRDIEMTHSFKEAHWDGKCGLPEEHQIALLVRAMETSEEDLADALEDL